MSSVDTVLAVELGIFLGVVMWGAGCGYSWLIRKVWRLFHGRD